uniref:Uncharacterized protein n=1 Tax=Opuntia streptacantha TaxID=393608 RepID=A0A7C9E8V4_OPUST
MIICSHAHHPPTTTQIQTHPAHLLLCTLSLKIRFFSHNKAHSLTLNIKEICLPILRKQKRGTKKKKKEMAELALEIPKIFMNKLISGGVKELCSFSQIKSHIKTLEEIKPIVEAWLLSADATQITNDAQRVEFNQLISALEKVHDSLNLREATAMRTQIMSRSRPIKK